MILVAVAAMFLILMLFIVFQFSLITGGSREVRNAVDAAALNVSKRVGELKVAAPEKFEDVADSGGKVGIANINRLWGKSLLINANAEEIQKEGLANQYTSQNANESYRLAQEANDALVNQLTDKVNLDTFFNQMAALRGAKLLGSDLKTVNGPGWDVGMVDRGAESNLSFDKKQFPKGTDVGAVDSNGKYLKGYTPVNMNGKTFCFTSFRPGEMPHLIPDSYFDKNNRNTSGIAGVNNPVPNAFRSHGIASSVKANLGASASSVANPRRQYSLSIPHAFVSLHMDNIARWIVNGKPVKISSYKFEPETVHGLKNFPLPSGAMLNGYASLGNEYKSGSLLQSINALPGDKNTPLQRLVQRVQEIKPDFSLAQLKSMLDKQAPGGFFVIYPTYKTPDNSDDPQLNITRVTEGASLPAWLNLAIAIDGMPKPIADETTQRDEPNYNWQNVVGGNPSGGEHWTEVSGKIVWTPGTGFGPCLGDLRISRQTVSNYQAE